MMITFNDKHMPEYIDVNLQSDCPSMQLVQDVSLQICNLLISISLVGGSLIRGLRMDTTLQCLNK